jgi:hypothetical protein
MIATKILESTLEKVIVVGGVYWKIFFRLKRRKGRT